MTDLVLCDLDGTLVDSNYHQTLAWYRAFQAHGFTPPVWHIHRCIGMGGDNLIDRLLGDVDPAVRTGLQHRWRSEFEALIDEVRPFEGAHDTLAALRDKGISIVLASSSPAPHVDHYVSLLDAGGLIQAATTGDDAENTKPAPDIVEVALQAAPKSDDPVMLGDSPWDVHAATRAGIPTVVVLTGGFAREELLSAGAREVVESITEVMGSLV